MGEKRKRSASPERREEVNDSGHQAADRCSTSPRFTSNPPQPTTDPPLPLTQSNLRQLDQETMPAKASKGGNSSSNDTSAAISEGGNIWQMGRRLLFHNGMSISDSDALARNPQVQTAAMSVLDTPREGLMGPDSPQRLKRAHEDAYESNELTFMITFWVQKLVKENRTVVEVVKASEDDSQKSSNKICNRSWREDGLQIEYDRLWKTHVVPLADTTDEPILEKVVKSLPKVQTPKPDISHGYWASEFNEDEHSINNADRRMTQLVEPQYHTFFIVEFKGTSGIISEARLQACRAGAAVIKATRDWRQEYGIEQPKPGTTVDTFAFSFSLIPELAEVNVHWAETNAKGRVRYHMNCLREHVLKNAQGREDARRDIYNVLDWGLKDRKDEVKRLLGEMQAKIEQQSPRKKQKKGSNEGDEEDELAND